MVCHVNLMMFGSSLSRKFEILSIFLICNGHDISLFYLLNLANIILFTNPNKAPRLLLFVLWRPLSLLSDSDILLLRFIDFRKSLKSRDSRLDSLILGEHLLHLGCKNHIVHGVNLRNSIIM